MVNPNPGLITDEMWQLWEGCSIPGVQLSGIYANKKGYHNTVNNNKINWPDNYSIKLPIDLKGLLTKSRAIDLTMSDAEMVKWTHRMKDSAENPDDHRLGAIREFYGTLDNKTVFGLIKDNTLGPWRKSSADSTHLWHGHTSIFTIFVNNWAMLSPILSVWRGQTFEEWSATNMGLPRKGDSGEEVTYWQYIHNAVRSTVSPPSPLLTIDGNYGSATAAAFKDFWEKKAKKTGFDGNAMTGWLAMRYMEAFDRVSVPPATSTIATQEQVQLAVDSWMNTHTHQFNFKGSIEGIGTLP